MAKISQSFLIQNQPNTILVTPKTYQGKIKIFRVPKPVTLNLSQCNLTLEASPGGNNGKDKTGATVIKRNKVDSMKKDDNTKEKVKESDNLANKTKNYYQKRSKKLLKEIEISNFLPHLNNESSQHKEKDKKHGAITSPDYELEKEKDKEINVYISSN